MKQLYREKLMTTLKGPSCLRLPGCGLLVLVLSGLLYPATASAVNDALKPFVESLQTTQQRAYERAAPSGQDEDLAEPTMPLEVTVYGRAGPDDSRLEQMAEDRRGPL